MGLNLENLNYDQATIDYTFRRSFDEFTLDNRCRPTHCVISAWIVDKLIATDSNGSRLCDDGTITYRGIRLIPSKGAKDLYFFIKL